MILMLKYIHDVDHFSAKYGEYYIHHYEGSKKITFTTYDKNSPEEENSKIDKLRIQMREYIKKSRLVEKTVLPYDVSSIISYVKSQTTKQFNLFPTGLIHSKWMIFSSEKPTLHMEVSSRTKLGLYRYDLEEEKMILLTKIKNSYVSLKITDGYLIIKKEP